MGPFTGEMWSGQIHAPLTLFIQHDHSHHITPHPLYPTLTIFILLSQKPDMVTRLLSRLMVSVPSQPSCQVILKSALFSEDSEYQNPNRHPAPGNCIVHPWSLCIWHFAIVGSLNKLLIKIKEHPAVSAWPADTELRNNASRFSGCLIVPSQQCSWSSQPQSSSIEGWREQHIEGAGTWQGHRCLQWREMFLQIEG